VRLFVGCEVGPEVGAAAASLIDALRARATAIAPQARLSWTPPERLHVTLRFIGYVENDRVRALRDALAAPLTHPPFDAAVQRVGVFPERHPPRVLWAGVGRGAGEIAAIAREVNARIGDTVAPAGEELRPHVTLARVKEPRGLTARALLAGFEAVDLGVMRVQSVTLFESRQSAGRLQYVPLLTTALRASDASAR
jgi:2'-5' RNA ligase